jgi:hypothetical protein
MINIYKYIFYRTFTWCSKKYRDDDVVTAYRAVLIVSFFVSMNILTIGLLVRALGLIDINVLHLPKIVIILIWLGVVAFLYFSFVYHNKYQIIEAEYKKETLKQRNINSVLILLFMIASFYVNLFI